MLQFYFLSVLSLLVGGATLIWGTPDTDKRLIRQTLAKRWMRITVGSVAGVTGILKLFVRAPGDTVPVAGDLLPVIAGLAVAVAIGAEFWTHGQASQNQSAAETGQGDTPRTASRIRELARYYKLPVGIAALTAGVVHFFVPGTVIV